MKYISMILTTIGLFTSLTAYSANGGIQLDRSRILIEGGEKSKNYAVSNHYQVPVLASAIVTNFDGTPSTAFAVSPSLYQIKPETTSQGQIVQLEQLPQDRESVFWLNVKTVTASHLADEKQEAQPHTNVGTMDIAISQRIKVFYRPKGVDETCAKAVNNLKWEKTDEGISVSNPSKVSVSIVNIKNNNKIYEIGEVVLPLSEKVFNVKVETKKNLSFKYVDEYGNFIDAPLNFN